MKDKKFWILTAVFGVLLAGAAAGYRFLSSEYAPGEPSAAETQNMQAAPDFTVLNEEGKGASLSDYEGKPVILNFWATWCGPCKSELPAFETAYRTYGEGIEFMMVNLTDSSRETEEVVRAFLEENQYTFPVYYDSLSSAANAYQVYGVPVTYFIDESGNIVNSYVGAMSEETLNSYIALLQEGEEP